MVQVNNLKMWPWDCTIILRLNVRAFMPVYPGANQGPSAHINNSHPRSIVTHRSTKAAALAEQGELLLQGPEQVPSPIETLVLNQGQLSIVVSVWESYLGSLFFHLSCGFFAAIRPRRPDSLSLL